MLKTEKGLNRLLRKNSEFIREGVDVFLRVEWKNDKDRCHKLAPVLEGLLKVTKTPDDNMVVIDRPDRLVEKVSCFRIVLARKPKAVKDVNDICKLLPEIMKNLGYHANEYSNKPDLTKPPKKGRQGV